MSTDIAGYVSNELMEWGFYIPISFSIKLF
jgi:hypothetical protein